MENTVLIDTGTRLKDLAETVIPCEIKKVVTWNTKKDKAVIHHKKVFKLAESIFAGANIYLQKMRRFRRPLHPILLYRLLLCL